MKFKMNNRDWEIKEVDDKDFIELTNDDSYYFGLTIRDEQQIWLNKNLCKEQKRQTLMHELLHCYIGCYLFNQESYTEEHVCNLSANAHDLIHKIIEEYFK